MFWVVDAFVRKPKSLDLSPFKYSKKVLEVLSFFNQTEVFASSPLIED